MTNHDKCVTETSHLVLAPGYTDATAQCLLWVYSKARNRPIVFARPANMTIMQDLVAPTNNAESRGKQGARGPRVAKVICLSTRHIRGLDASTCVVTFTNQFRRGLTLETPHFSRHAPRAGTVGIDSSHCPIRQPKSAPEKYLLARI